MFGGAGLQNTCNLYKVLFLRNFRPTERAKPEETPQAVSASKLPAISN
jgi:hypothetical protein